MLPLARRASLGLVLLSSILGVGLVSPPLAEGGHTYLRFPWRFGAEGYITQGYATDPAGSSHAGGDYYALDIDIEWGGTLGDIAAAAYGQVVGKVTGSYCNPDLDYGNYVKVKSTTPAGETRYALYAHMSSVSVSSNQTVFQGQKLGVEGDTGDTVGSQPNGCGAHLHFRWTTSQNCSSSLCAVRPEPMSGQTGFAAGQTKTSDNYVRRSVFILAGDYNADGKADIAVWRPSDRKWYVRPDNTGVQWGISTDIPVPGDYDSDPADDFAVWRPSESYPKWYVYPNSTGTQWGISSDIPVPADYNADGKTDIAVWRPSDRKWYVRPDNTGVQWGISTDIPVPSDYDSDPYDDLAVWRPSDGRWYVYPDNTGIEWGLSTDIPAPADYNGDGKTDLAVWRPSDGKWYVYPNNQGVEWGILTDHPVAGDYNVSGKDDLAVWRPTDSQPRWYIWEDRTGIQWGIETDVPLAGLQRW